jgi:hypothetical protein
LVGFSTNIIDTPDKGTPVQELLSSWVHPWQISIKATPMNLRIVLWTLCFAYVGFLLAGGKNASSITIVMAAALIGAALGLGLGTMFNRRAARKHM